MSTLSPRDARLAYALLQLRSAQLAKEAKRIAAAIKVIEPSIDQEPGDKNAAKLGHARLGTVQKTDPNLKARVADRDAFTKWIEENAATEVETVTTTTVRPAYEAKLLDDMTAAQAAVDGNGEIVPGIALEYASVASQRFYAEVDATEMLTVVTRADLPDIEGVNLADLLGISAEQGASESQSRIAEVATPAATGTRADQ